MYKLLSNSRPMLPMLIMAAWGVCSASVSQANVNLEWRQEPGTVSVGDTVRVGLYAVSDDASDQPVSGLQVIFSWDPEFLQLLGLDNNSPYAWGAPGFPPDPYGLNEAFPPQDGDGIFTAWANLQGPAFATPGGLLVTTFEFTAVKATPGTGLGIEPSGGSPLAYSTVYGPSGDVTGTLQGTTIVILGCLCGDLNGSGFVDLDDFATFATCFALESPVLDCDAAEFACSDLNGSGVVNLDDFATFAVLYAQATTGSPPNCLD